MDCGNTSGNLTVCQAYIAGPAVTAHTRLRIAALTTATSNSRNCNCHTCRTTHPPHIMSTVQSVQCFGKKKTATAVAHCKQGKGLIKVNGRPLSLVEPAILRFKVYEPILILGLDKFGM